MRSTISLLNGTSTQYLYTGDKLVLVQNKTGTDGGYVYLNNVFTNPSFTIDNSNFSLAQGVVKVTLVDTTSSQQIASITASAS